MNNANIKIKSFDPKKHSQQKIHSFFSQGMYEITKKAFKKYYLKNLPIFIPFHFAHISLSYFYQIKNFFLINFSLLILPPVSIYAVWSLIMRKYVKMSVEGDLFDISLFYTQPEHQMSNFWVALMDKGEDKREEEIVGCVAVEAHFQTEQVSNKNYAVPSYLKKRYSSNSNLPTAELRRMSVKKEYRGMGISKLLLETVVDFCKRKGFRCLWLSTTDLQTEAEKLYLSNGFKFVYEKRVFFGIVGIRFYELDLINNK